MTMNRASSSDHKKYALEAPLTAKVKGWLELQTDIAFYKASDRYNKGVSDLVLCVGGVFCAIELKAEYNEMSAHQKLFIKQIRAAGGVAGDAYTLAEVKSLVEEARCKANALKDSV